MSWERRAAPVLKSIEEGEKKGREVQPAQQAILDARPELDALEMQVVLRVVKAWHDLDTCRPIGMQVGKIPWTAIDTWARRQRDLGDEARAILIDAIRHVDDVEYAERNKKQPGKPPAPRGPIARQAQGAGQ